MNLFTIQTRYLPKAIYGSNPDILNIVEIPLIQQKIFIDCFHIYIYCWEQIFFFSRTNKC